jgi:(4-(4-[2-(gamma-L-glutamylamino)ethyl]phenoxymethyl)furan-2-yl)methanamine synthase
MSRYYGWDVGGAHLKLAVLDDGVLVDVRQLACPLWQGQDRLSQLLRTLAESLPLARGRHALTMTGELCDVFPSREVGVCEITGLMRDGLGNAPAIYAGSRGWFTPAETNQNPLVVASQNWHATAAWVAQRGEYAYLVDIGSTTTDIIATRERQVMARGHDDAARLAAGELVYTGITRTAVMAVTQRVPFAGEWRGIAREYFATMADIYRITGDLPDGMDLHPTADGRPPDRAHSLLRLARMLGEDSQADERALEACARFIAFTQLSDIQRGLAQVISRSPLPTPHVIGAGTGEFLARRLAEFNGFDYRGFGDIVDAPPSLREAASHCAPAVAVAKLAHQGHL